MHHSSVETLIACCPYAGLVAVHYLFSIVTATTNITSTANNHRVSVFIRLCVRVANAKCT